MIALFQVDQIILKFLIGIEAVAIYGLSYKLGSAIQYINTSFSLAWYPHLFSLKDNKAKENIYSLLGYYLALILLAGITDKVFFYLKICTDVLHFHLPPITLYQALYL